MEKSEVQAAAGSLAIEAVPLEIRRAEDIGPTLEAIKGQVDALYVVIDALSPVIWAASAGDGMVLKGKFPSQSAVSSI
jgi:ABC-type uncharacterized transport system substrate-binding protein